jgi:Holliday junction resolvasome RuvABC endonuclease subunit
MGLKDLAVKDDKRVLAIDASTNSFAFALFEGTKLVKYGEIDFVGKTVFDRLADAQIKLSAMKDHLEADEIVIEGATYVQNKRTVILLAYCFGAIISAVKRPGAEVIEVPPITWQNAIGNKQE